MSRLEPVCASEAYEHEFSITSNVQYKQDEPAAVLDVIVPMRVMMRDSDNESLLPIVIFVQGSGWTTPDRAYALRRLENLSENGFVVCSVSHRDSSDGEHPFPSFLEDVKSAIRFMKIHAGEFHGDAQRLGIWGTSSGGNAALLVNMTQGDERYDDETNAGVSDSVDYCVACFPPSDIYGSLSGDFACAKEDLAGCLAAVVGRKSQSESLHKVWENLSSMGRDRAWDMSPYRLVKSGEDYSPVLLVHGDNDALVPYEESEQLYSAYINSGHDCTFLRVLGGEHEGNTWSDELMNAITSFIIQHA